MKVPSLVTPTNRRPLIRPSRRLPNSISWLDENATGLPPVERSSARRFAASSLGSVFSHGINDRLPGRSETPSASPRYAVVLNRGAYGHDGHYHYHRVDRFGVDVCHRQAARLLAP